MKLNLGAGCPTKQHVTPEWVNVEYCVLPGMEHKRLIFADGKCLPFKNNTFEEIHCIHMLEHVDRKDHPILIKEMFRVLKPDSIVYIEVPDIIKVCEAIYKTYTAHPLNPKTMERLRCQILSIYGKGRYEGDTHRWGFYPEHLKTLMEAEGFQVSFPSTMISNHYKQEPVILACGRKNNLI